MAVTAAEATHQLARHLLAAVEDERYLEKYIAALEQLGHHQHGLIHFVSDQTKHWEATCRTLSISGNDAGAVNTVIADRLQILYQTVEQLFGELALHTVVGWQQFVATLCQYVPHTSLRGQFVRWPVLQELLVQHEPNQLLQYLGYTSMSDCLTKESLPEIMAALRFSEDNDWMLHFLQSYRQLRASDFEERAVQFVLLAPDKWWPLAEPFAAKKKHCFSHLKEAGVIFCYPNPKRQPGGDELTLFVLMMLHYINEVYFYTRWVQHHAAHNPHFGPNFVRILKGDGSVCATSRYSLPIIQQYHLKRPQPHPCVFRPHVMPEVLHWHKAFTAFFKLLQSQPNYQLLAFWQNCYTVGQLVGDQLLTFNLSDNLLSTTIPLTYHYKEAVWNGLFNSYYNEVILERNIIQHLADQHINLHTLTT